MSESVKEKWLGFLKQMFEVDEKKRKIQQAFTEGFGIKPQQVSVNHAVRVFDLNDEEQKIAEDIIRASGISLDEGEYCQLVLRVYTADGLDDHDWQVDEYSVAKIQKISNGFQYEVEVRIVENGDE